MGLFANQFRSRLNKARRRNVNERGIGRVIEVLEDRRMLATIPVTLASDAQDPSGTDGGITLREAIRYVNEGQASIPQGDLNLNLFDPATLGTDDKIVFDPSVTGLIGLQHGELLIDRSVEIIGPGADQLTITAGNGPDNLFGTGDGHRIFTAYSQTSPNGDDFDLTLRGLTLTGGDASVSGIDGTDWGGAIYVDDDFRGSVDITLDQMALVDNYAERGGAVYVNQFGSGPMTLVVMDSVFEGNESNTLGGALVLDGVDAQFTKSVIRGNGTRFIAAQRGADTIDLGSGGGVALLGGSETVFDNSIIADNFSGHHGGGIYTVNSGFKDVFIRNSSLYGNLAQFDGGGVYFCPKGGDADETTFDLVIANTTLADNRAGTTTSGMNGRGGGVFVGAERRGTAVGNAELDVAIHNVTITDNTAADGAGIFGYIGDDSDLTSNSSRASLDITMHNSIVALNTGASDIDGEIISDGLTGEDEQFFTPASSHNRLGAVASPLDLEFFVANDNLLNQTQTELQLGDLGFFGGFDTEFFTVPFRTDGPVSTAIDAGDNAQAIDPSDGSALLFDQRGSEATNGMADYARLFNWSDPENPSGAIVDVGAYESQPTIPRDPDDPDPPDPPDGNCVLIQNPNGNLIGDFNRDFSVNAADYTLWRDTLGQSVTPFTGADANGDGIINETDYCLWSLQYGASNPIPLADYNNDGVVDAADYTIWRDSFGQTGPGLAADGNNDGVVDGIDWYLWRETYGSTTADPLFALFSAVPTPYVYTVGTTADQFDTPAGLDGLSLREAIEQANNAGGPATVVLPTGRYALTRTGAEPTSGHDNSVNDLHITGDVQVVGEGAGLSVIDLDNLIVNAHRRAFDVAGSGRLDLSGVTIANADVHYSYKGAAIEVDSGGELILTDSAIVANKTNQQGTGIYSEGGNVTLRRTVFTNNKSTYQGGQAVYAIADGAIGGSLTIGESIFALNWDVTPSGPNDPNVLVGAGVALTNEGKNLYDDASGGFFDTTPGVDDHLGTPDYVVSTLADSFDHTDDDESLSIREAIDLANQTSGAKEIWLPAWAFELTRDRATYGGGSATDTDVSFGDLDIHDQLTIRGVKERTSVAWKAGVVDSVFDLLGDYNNSGAADQDVDSADYTVWNAQNGSGSGTSTDWEVYAADGDDDGDVDAADHALWSAYYGNSLDMFDVLS